MISCYQFTKGLLTDFTTPQEEWNFLNDYGECTLELEEWLRLWIGFILAEHGPPIIMMFDKQAYNLLDEDEKEIWIKKIMKAYSNLNK